jgi:hypothetical protein
VVEAIDQISKESADLGKLKKSKLANKLGYDPRADSVVPKSRNGVNVDAHQRQMLSAFVAGYARAREQMRCDREEVPERRDAGKAIMNQHQG